MISLDIYDLFVRNVHSINWKRSKTYVVKKIFFWLFIHPCSPELFSQGGEGRDQDQLAGLFSDEPEAEEDEDGDDWIDL